MSAPAADGVTARLLPQAPWRVDGPARRIMTQLEAQGAQARVVGGAVRNQLLGLPSGDTDIATTATPDVVTRILGAAGYKVVPTGIAHGTVTAIVDGVPLEITTLRVDVETFGRQARVRFGTDWRADAERRDFTMNALSSDRAGRVYDYTGGLADLDARHVRFIGDAAMRIAEDHLRILRFFRFHAIYGAGTLDAEGLHACTQGRAGLAALSRERVRMEFLKILVAPRAGDALMEMNKAQVLPLVLGGAAALPAFLRIVEIESALATEAQPMRRLAALAGASPADAVRLGEALRLSNADRARLAAMVAACGDITAAASVNVARGLLYRLGAQTYTDAAMLAWARTQAALDDARWRALVTLPQVWSVPVFPIKAAHLIARGVVRGPALGAAMRDVEAAWIEADFPQAGPVLDALMQEAAERHKPG